LAFCQQIYHATTTAFSKNCYRINIPPFKDITRLNFIVALENGRYEYILFERKHNLLPKL